MCLLTLALPPSSSPSSSSSSSSGHLGGEDESEAGGEEEDAVAAAETAEDRDLFAFVKSREASGLGQGSFWNAAMGFDSWDKRDKMKHSSYSVHTRYTNLVLEPGRPIRG